MDILRNKDLSNKVLTNSVKYISKIASENITTPKREIKTMYLEDVD
jgi:hypothetical protein